MRLAIELDRQGVSSWVTRVVLTYLRNELVLAFKSAAPVALAISGLRGSVQPALKAQAPGNGRLGPVTRGLEGHRGGDRRGADDQADGVDVERGAADGGQAFDGLRGQSTVAGLNSPPAMWTTFPAFLSEGWWPGGKLNPRHHDFQLRALPTGATLAPERLTSDSAELFDGARLGRPPRTNQAHAETNELPPP